MKALLAVYDKTNLDVIASALVKMGWELLATGGTYKKIKEYNLPVTAVSDFTGQQELLEGRVKTLHPKIHAGILYRRDNNSDKEEIKNGKFEAIDIVICNLYPFSETIASNEDITVAEAVEQIDIGGPTMLRASAKNFEHVLSVSSPEFYDDVIANLKKYTNKIAKIPTEFKKQLAQSTFLHTTKYDSLIAEYFADIDNQFPDEKIISLQKIMELRYGENPHQSGALYKVHSINNLINKNTGPVQHHGKGMSYVNVLDADAAYKLVCDFKEPAVAIIKHTNPCCFSSGNSSLSNLYGDALDYGDAVSAFGGIVAVNRIIDKSFAETLRSKLSPLNGNKMFFEIIIAPGFDDDGLEHLKKKSKDLRIISMNPYLWESETNDFTSVHGGFLSQSVDHSDDKFDLISGDQIDSKKMDDLMISWKIVKHIKSNAIAIVKNGTLLGMGAGQPNRVESTKLALNSAGDQKMGAVLASDAFFPFSDSITIAGEAGIQAVVQPGGSIRDQETIEVAKKFALSLFHTGTRHFRH